MEPHNNEDHIERKNNAEIASNSINTKKQYKPLEIDRSWKIIEEGIAEEELNKSLDNIPSSTEFWQQTDKLTQAIQEDPTLKDPEHKNVVQNFMESIKSGNYIDAFKSLFDFVKNILWPNDANDNTFWFKDNKEIQNFMIRLSKNIDHLSIVELENQQKNLINKIENTSGVKKKIGLTYALSRLLDEIVYKKHPNKSWMKWHSDGSVWDHINNINIAKMAQQVKPWDILAVNKSEQKIWDKLLTRLADDDLDTSHVLIVTAVDSESGKITVAHSTWSKVNSSWKWVETNLDFAKYTNQFNGIAIAALRPPENISQDLVTNVLAKDSKWYDEWAAASTALLWSNITKNNDKYNCVELIAQSFPDSVSSKRKDWTHPSQMLQELKPTYVTVAWKSIWGS